MFAAYHLQFRDAEVTVVRQVIEKRIEDRAGGGALSVEGRESSETPEVDAIAEGAKDGDEGVGFGFGFGGVCVGLEGFVGLHFQAVDFLREVGAEDGGEGDVLAAIDAVDVDYQAVEVRKRDYTGGEEGVCEHRSSGTNQRLCNMRTSST